MSSPTQSEQELSRHSRNQLAGKNMWFCPENTFNRVVSQGATLSPPSFGSRSFLGPGLSDKWILPKPSVVPFPVFQNLCFPQSSSHSMISFPVSFPFGIGMGVGGNLPPPSAFSVVGSGARHFAVAQGTECSTDQSTFLIHRDSGFDEVLSPVSSSAVGTVTDRSKFPHLADLLENRTAAGECKFPGVSNTSLSSSRKSKRGRPSTPSDGIKKWTRLAPLLPKHQTNCDRPVDITGKAIRTVQPTKKIGRPFKVQKKNSPKKLRPLLAKDLPLKEFIALMEGPCEEWVPVDLDRPDDPIESSTGRFIDNLYVSDILDLEESPRYDAAESKLTGHEQNKAAKKRESAELTGHGLEKSPKRRESVELPGYGHGKTEKKHQSPDTTSQDKSAEEHELAKPSEGQSKKSRTRRPKWRSYVCKTCGRSFQYPRSLLTHQLVHQDIRPHKCPFPGCDKAFRQTGHLQTHLLIHTGEKPFKCPVSGCPTLPFRHANRRCPIHSESRLKKTAGVDKPLDLSFRSCMNQREVADKHGGETETVSALSSVSRLDTREREVAVALTLLQFATSGRVAPNS